MIDNHGNNINFNQTEKANLPLLLAQLIRADDEVPVQDDLVAAISSLSAAKGAQSLVDVSDRHG